MPEPTKDTAPAPTATRVMRGLRIGTSPVMSPKRGKKKTPAKKAPAAGPTRSR